MFVLHVQRSVWCKAEQWNIFMYYIIVIFKIMIHINIRKSIQINILILTLIYYPKIILSSLFWNLNIHSFHHNIHLYLSFNDVDQQQ